MTALEIRRDFSNMFSEVSFYIYKYETPLWNEIRIRVSPDSAALSVKHRIISFIEDNEVLDDGSMLREEFLSLDAPVYLSVDQEAEAMRSVLETNFSIDTPYAVNGDEISISIAYENKEAIEFIKKAFPRVCINIYKKCSSSLPKIDASSVSSAVICVTGKFMNRMTPRFKIFDESVWYAVEIDCGENMICECMYGYEWFIPQDQDILKHH